MVAVKAKCMQCDRPAFCRGVCYNHYHVVYRAVKRGRLRTWSNAEKNGLALSRKSKPGPKSTV